ncbi:tubulin-specific chaperone C [Drosophila novamexicana]|uniref:tubulin-specific chaperone C n=1 Tax=Drosophila novamexicana TaxID=47314 RepID=UPI0011E5981D|nr:tubulin-specific chaperone C [Drosophila novamexicana]
MYVSGLKTFTGSYNCNNNNRNYNRRGSQFNLQPKFAQLFSCWPVLNTLTFLMNDFRLKSLYRATKKTITTTTTAAAAATTTATTTNFDNSNINNPRTYNNSSKSNKVFLHYIPRDPRLRIFNKTATLNKHLAHPQRTLSELNITEDLCNYGELIGGSDSDNNNYNNNHNYYNNNKQLKFQGLLFKF